jgi:16S rRNA (guanine(966)-N(2))-methyltransferase RsmD
MMMSLSIISGIYRGRKLQAPKGLGVRPTTARVRQRVFDTLQALWVGSIGLDGFSGSGAIGFEALSRGAKYVTACEPIPTHAACIQGNAKTLGVTAEHYTLFKNTCEAWLTAQAQGDGLQQLDWVYLDAPYGYEGLPHLVEAFAVGLPTDAFLIVEHGASPQEVQHLEVIQAKHPRLTLYRHIPAGDSAVHVFVLR